MVTLSIQPHLLGLVFSSLQGSGHPNRTAELSRDCNTSTSHLTLELFLAESRTLHTELQDASVGHVPSQGELTLQACPGPNLLWSSSYRQSLITLLRKANQVAGKASSRIDLGSGILPRTLNQEVKGQLCPLLTSTRGVRGNQGPSK